MPAEPESPRPFQSSLRGAPVAALLCVVASLHPPLLWAGEQGPPGRHAAAAVGAVWISGGIGDEDRAAMQKAAAGFNVRVIFSGRAGEYHAGLPFQIFRSDGRLLVSGVSDGPWLYLRLRPGTYRITADIDGVSYSRAFQAPTAGQTRQLSFIAGGV